MMFSSRAFSAIAFCILNSAFCLCATGCGAIGYAANALPQNVKPQYTGLLGQPVGIIVWADRGIMIDWGPIQLDLANAVENKLLTSKAEETKGTTFPYEPKSYVRYLRDHPGTDTLPITDIAPRF